MSAVQPSLHPTLQAVANDALTLILTDSGVSMVQIEEVFERHGIEFAGDLALEQDPMSNVITWFNVNTDFRDVFNWLKSSGQVHLWPCNPLVYLTDGKVPGAPLAGSRARYSTPRWLPLAWRRGNGDEAFRRWKAAQR